MLRDRAEVLQTELQMRAASFSELAVAPYIAQLELLKTFMSQTAAREAKALVSAKKTLSAVDDFKDALSVARLHRVLTRPPDGSNNNSNNNNCNGGSESGEMRTLARTPWATARAAFEASLADAVETVTPRTAVCEVDVPLSALASPAAAVELGTAELCGVAFVCRVRRGCSCGTAPLLLQTNPQSSASSASASASASASVSAIECASASASVSESVAAAVEGADASRALALCACAIVGEIEARTASDAIALRYNECAARVKAVAELIDTGDDADDGEDGSGRACSSASVTKDVVFGTVCAEFALVNPPDAAATAAAAAGAAAVAAVNQAFPKCNVLLTDPNKRVAGVALAKYADLSSAYGHSGDGTASAVRVRCAIAFPDVFHQARALQLCVDAMAVEFVAAQQALAQGSAAAEMALAGSRRETQKMRIRVEMMEEMQQFVRSEETTRKALMNFLNAHVEIVQRDGGYFLRCTCTSSRCQTWGSPHSSAVHINVEPSATVLLKLQEIARECVIADARKALDELKMTSDVIMIAHLRSRIFTLVIRPDDENAPSNAAHFRTAAAQTRLCQLIHKCYAPPNQFASTLPFITMSKECSTRPITVPVGDLLYGENSLLSTTAASDPDIVIEHVYPSGTVLMCARAVPNFQVVKQSGSANTNNTNLEGCDNPTGTSDTPWFIVIEACAAKLLPGGAVPVGRVMSCVEAQTPATEDFGDAPFTPFNSEWTRTYCHGVTSIAFAKFWSR